MSALRLFVRLRWLVFVAMCFSPRLFADSPECANWGGVKESSPIHFLEFNVEASAQKTLLDLDDRWGPTWMQVVFEDSELRFENKMQGLGLPFNIFHIKTEWLLPDGSLIEGESFPANNRCQAMSLFPGGISQSLPLVRPKSQALLRLRIRVWSSGL